MNNAEINPIRQKVDDERLGFELTHIIHILDTVHDFDYDSADLGEKFKMNNKKVELIIIMINRIKEDDRTESIYSNRSPVESNEAIENTLTHILTMLEALYEFDSETENTELIVQMNDTKIKLLDRLLESLHETNRKITTKLYASTSDEVGNEVSNIV